MINTLIIQYFAPLLRNNSINCIVQFLFCYLLNQIPKLQFYLYKHIIYKMQADNTQQCLKVLQKLMIQLKPSNSTSMKSAIIALYTADVKGSLWYSGCIGLLQLDVNRQLKAKLLRVYDIQSLELVFEVEMYYGFKENYRSITDTFYVFDYLRGCFGFQFRNKNDADIMKLKIGSNSQSLEDFQIVRKHNIEEQERKRQENSVIGKLKNLLFKPTEIISPSVITNFKVQQAIKFNKLTNQFQVNGLSKQFQDMIQNFTQGTTQNQKKEIMNTIAQVSMFQLIKKQAEIEADTEVLQKLKQIEADINKEDMDVANGGRRVTNCDRLNLLQQIRNKNVKLKPVDQSNEISADISSFNKEEKIDLQAHIKIRLEKRRLLLNRRED